MEEIKDDSLMKQVQPISMEDHELKYEKVELSICDEDYYTSIFPFKYTDHLKDEDIQDDLISAFSKYPPLIDDHLSNDDIYEMLKPFDLMLNSHVKRINDHNGGFGYVVIDEFLESTKKERVKDEITNMLHLETQ